MDKFTPLGVLILVKPIAKSEKTTEDNIILVESQTVYGEVVEVSDMVSDTYKKGDIVAYSAGCNKCAYYNGKQHIWLNGNGYGVNGGEIWYIVG